MLLFPKGYILDRIMEYRPAWKPRVMEWIEKNASCVVSVDQVRPSVHLLSFPFPSYTPSRPPHHAQAVEQYQDLYPLYIKYCTEKIIAKIDIHIGKNFEGDGSMKEGWATTVFIEKI